ncbi:MAG TPA: AzlD domain-containing protein [Ramlibacter sp.]|nr:AzlD domain-containing protein [Ramlibacter sp.]
MSSWETLACILGMALITFVCRSLFLLPREEVGMPRWLREGLRYAPLAALTAVVTPDILMTDGELIDTWKDARVFGAAAGIAWYFWRGSILGTMAVGTGTLMLLRVTLGW